MKDPSTPTAKREITFIVPKDFEDMTEEHMQLAIQQINNELGELAEERRQLQGQRRLIETVMYILFPGSAELAGYAGANRVVMARLRRAKELLAGDGKTKNEEHRALAESVEAVENERVKKLIQHVPTPATE